MADENNSQRDSDGGRNLDLDALRLSDGSVNSDLLNDSMSSELSSPNRVDNNSRNFNGKRLLLADSPVSKLTSSYIEHLINLLPRRLQDVELGNYRRLKEGRGKN